VGSFARFLEAVLLAEGFALVHTPGIAVNRAAKGFSGGERKSDPRDARTIAELVRTRDLRPILPDDDTLVALRLRVGRRRELIQDQTLRIFEEMATDWLDGRFPRMIDKLAPVQLLVLDNWGTHSLTDQQRLDLLELFEERYQRPSTIITAQLPISGWHQMIGEPTIADAILDRIVRDSCVAC
jgi:hypothetical protein